MQSLSGRTAPRTAKQRNREMMPGVQETLPKLSRRHRETLGGLRKMSKGPWNPLYCPAWYVQAAEVMVRTSCSLKVAALEVGHPLDPDEADKVSRRRDFQEILRVEKNKFYSSLANDPTRTKSVVLGQMWYLADRLIAEGEFEKAAGVLDKLSKMEGWSGNEGNINIFSGLTARDIAEARSRLAGVREESTKRAESREINQLPARTESLQN